MHTTILLITPGAFHSGHQAGKATRKVATDRTRTLESDKKGSPCMLVFSAGLLLGYESYGQKLMLLLASHEAAPKVATLD